MTIACSSITYKKPSVKKRNHNKICQQYRCGMRSRNLRELGIASLNDRRDVVVFMSLSFQEYLKTSFRHISKQSQLDLQIVSPCVSFQNSEDHLPSEDTYHTTLSIETLDETKQTLKPIIKTSSAIPETAKKQYRTVHFQQYVVVAQIPNRCDYTDEERFHMWYGRDTLHVMARRNSVEKRWEKFMNNGQAVEENQFWPYYDGTLIHPAFYRQSYVPVLHPQLIYVVE